MKRFIISLLVLVAIAAGLQAQTDYGFSIKGVRINSQNYQSQATNQAWYYDPSTNVLHLTNGELRPYQDAPMIYIDGDKNPSLNISVDGDFKMRGQYAIGFYFAGSGNHTIYGKGTITMTSDVINPKMVNSNGNVTQLTIKDLTWNMTAYGDGSVGIVNAFASITFDNCELNISTGYAAFLSNDAAVGSDGVEPTFIRCYLSSGWPGRTFWEAYGVSKILKEAYIKRAISVVNVNVEEPQIGNSPSTNYDIYDEGYDATAVEWYAYYQDLGLFKWTSPFQLNGTYVVSMILKPVGGNRFADAEYMTAYVNGNPATVSRGADDYVAIEYTFPTLAEKYGLKVYGTEVTSANLNDILGDGVFNYSPSNKTLNVRGDNLSNFDAFLENKSVAGLQVNISGSVTLKAMHGIIAYASTKITGPGHLTIKTGGVVTDFYDGANLTIEDIAIDAESQNYGIAGEDNGACLFIRNSTVKVKGPLGAMCDFDGGITMAECNLIEPKGGYVENGDVLDASGNLATEVVIARNGDANLDGVVDIADVVAVLNAMANDSNAPQFNVNGDAAVDIADVVAVLNIMAQQ